MTDPQAYKEAFREADSVLLGTAKNVNVFSYLSPTNEISARDKFVRDGGNGDPEFTYKPLGHDLDVVRARLEALDISDDDLGLGAIYEGKRRELLLKNDILRHRRDEGFVRDAVMELYGEPSDRLVKYADQLLRETPATERKEKIPAEEVKRAIEDFLAENGVTDWTVEYTDKFLTTVIPAERRITLCRDREFKEGEAERLAVHEVGVHALRSVNGYEQKPLNIFGSGLPGYIRTAEGLASLAEKLTGTETNDDIRISGGHVIAVKSLRNGLRFKDTFNLLTSSYGFSNNEAWRIAVKAYRGGGLCTGHIYLDGELKVREWTEQNGDYKTLCVGKIGLEHLPLARKLLERGILREAKYVPRFFQAIGAKSK